MNLTYECGTCNSIYSFDTTHITTNGIKVTCPKCLTFFVLKNKKEMHASEPMIEKVAEKDGAFQINFPTSPKIEVDLELPETLSPHQTDPKLDASLETLSFLPSEPIEETLPRQKEEPVSDLVELPADLLSVDSFDELLERKSVSYDISKKHKDQIDETGKLNATQNILTSAELSDYPDELPPESKLDSLLIPLSLIVLALSALLFLNYKGIIFIPGFENLREEKMGAVPAATATPQTIVTPKAQYGFPIIEDSPIGLEKSENKDPTTDPQK